MEPPIRKNSEDKITRAHWGTKVIVQGLFSSSLCPRGTAVLFLEEPVA